MMSAPARWEYLKAIQARYRLAGRPDRGPILDEFCKNTGYHRKYALRLLNGPPRRVGRHRRRGGSFDGLLELSAAQEVGGFRDAPWPPH